MKKGIELNADFIGGQEPLTKEEERMLSDFIQARKSPALNKNLSDNRQSVHPLKRVCAAHR